SKAAMTRVMEGGCTPSFAANSPGVIAPDLARQNSADSWDSVILESPLWARSRRPRRTTARRSLLARVCSRSTVSDTSLVYQTTLKTGQNNHAAPLLVRRLPLPITQRVTTAPRVRARRNQHHPRGLSPERLTDRI